MVHTSEKNAVMGRPMTAYNVRFLIWRPDYTTGEFFLKQQNRAAPSWQEDYRPMLFRLSQLESDGSMTSNKRSVQAN